ncbi:MAG: hypothetical protein ABH872_04255 [Candidatus Omnitrophota bacterium]
MKYNKVMPSASDKKISVFVLSFIFASIVLCLGLLQFTPSAFYGADSYYHAACANFIKDYGINYDFRWAQFSTFKDFFSDKDLLFHLVIVPFTFFSDDLVLCGKYAILFFNTLFLSVFVYLLRKYVPDFIAACILLLLFFSTIFTLYFLYLRPATLANIFILLGVFFLINKSFVKVFFLSLLFPMAHLSFFMIVVLALACEIVRYVKNKEFFSKNITAAFIGVILGCLIHPHFPNNLLSIYLNDFLVPFYIITRPGLEFGREFISSPANVVLMKNFAVFLIFAIIVWATFLKNFALSFSTLVWFSAANIYIFLAFSSNRFWYPANGLFLIFLASWLKDWSANRQWSLLRAKILCTALVAAVILYGVSAISFKQLKETMKFQIAHNTYRENAARWMKDNIPEGETVYHSDWSDSSRFICLNPKNNYFVVLDPIYMYYYSPVKYALYRGLKYGAFRPPYKILKKAFGVNYGYVLNDSKIAEIIKSDPAHYKILYSDKGGIIFKIIDNN